MAAQPGMMCQQEIVALESVQLQIARVTLQLPKSSDFFTSINPGVGQIFFFGLVSMIYEKPWLLWRLLHKEEPPGL